MFMFVFNLSFSLFKEVEYIDSSMRSELVKIAKW